MFSIKKIAAIVVVTLIVLTGVSFAFVNMDQTDDGTDDGETVLTIGTTTVVTNATLSNSLFAYMIQAVSHLPLIDWNGGVAIPTLASNYSSNSNFTEYTFNLRHDVKWSDGMDFTADDVVLTVERQVYANNPKYSGVEKIDNYTVKIILKSSNANFPAENLNLPIRPAHVYEDVGFANWTTYTGLDALVATGPLYCTGVDAAAGEITFLPNEYYYGGTPSIDKVVMKMYSTTDAMMMALLNGEVDTVYNYLIPGMDVNYLSSVLKKDNLDIMPIETAALGPSLWFNQDTVVGANLSIRQAVRYAMNYEEIISYLAPGVGEVPNTGVWTPRGAFYKGTEQMEYNATKAGLLLDSAGYTIKAGDTYRTNSTGDVLTIDLLVRSTDTACVKACDFITEYLNDVGIQTSIKITPSTASFNSERATDKYEITVYLWTAGAMDSHLGFLTAPLYMSKMMGDNIGSYPEVVALVKELSTTAVSDRESIAGEIQDYWSENAPVVPLYWYSYLQPYNNEFTGFSSHTCWGVFCVETVMNVQST